MSEILKKQLSDAEEAGRRMAKQLFEVERERDALAAKLKELEGQEPVAWAVKNGLVLDCVKHSEKRALASAAEPQKRHDLSGSLAAYRVEALFARPVPAEPVNARLLQAVKNLLSWIDDYAETSDPCFAKVEKQAQDALAAAEAQQAELESGRFARVPKRLTREMESVLAEEGWEWADLLAAAEAITEEEYNGLLDDEQADPVRLTDEEILNLWWNNSHIHKVGERRVGCGRSIEAAVLRANGYKVEG